MFEPLPPVYPALSLNPPRIFPKHQLHLILNNRYGNGSVWTPWIAKHQIKQIYLTLELWKTRLMYQWHLSYRPHKSSECFFSNILKYPLHCYFSQTFSWCATGQTTKLQMILKSSNFYSCSLQHQTPPSTYWSFKSVSIKRKYKGSEC